MKKSSGILIALIAGAVGAAATIFAIKKKRELDQYAYDEFDDEFFGDCDCDDCDCEDCDCEDCDCDCCDEEIELASIEDEIEDENSPSKSDF